jgi:DNA-directed RNA polymerase subunit omega
MIFPLEELIEYNGNMYEITCAIMRRSYQLAVVREPEVEKNEGKVVSFAARQIFSKQIEYRLEK